jgi:hypothetical protein
VQAERTCVQTGAKERSVGVLHSTNRWFLGDFWPLKKWQQNEKWEKRVKKGGGKVVEKWWKSSGKVVEKCGKVVCKQRGAVCKQMQMRDQWVSYTRQIGAPWVASGL